MRWGPSKFALFAVVAVAIIATAPPAKAQTKEESETILLWTPDSPEPRPGARSKFFVRVAGDADTRPAGSVSVKLDENEAETHALTTDDVDADGNLARKTEVFERFLKDQEPHRIETVYGGDDAVRGSDDLLHVPVGSFSATYEDGFVVWRFVLRLRNGTPRDEIEDARTDKTVSVVVDGARAHTVPLDSELRATLRTLESTGNHSATANYSGDLTFQPVQRTAAVHVPEPSATSVAGSPAPPPPPRPTTTRPSPRRATPTTAALAPINPGPSTTIAGLETTSTLRTFGDFVTSAPPRTNEIATASNNGDEGPPVAVVAGTLLALSALGGVAAYRRYRKGGIDWF